jgi:hypothetical protein
MIAAADTSLSSSKGKDAAATLSRRLSRPIIQPLLMLSMSTSARECHRAVRRVRSLLREQVKQNGTLD